MVKRTALALVLLSLLTSASQTGCVQRRMTVRTNPPGALLYVDDYPIGITPISTNFIYYGTRKIRLVKDGYETLTVLQPIPTPWYEIPPLDFVTENLVPGKIRDERVLDFQLKPQMVVPSEQLLQRAEGLRQASHQTGPAPFTATPPAFSPAPGPTVPSLPPPSAGPEPIATPPGIGGQIVPPLPPR